MKKIDYKKELKDLYRPSAKKVVEINVPKMNFLMIDGKGAPGSIDHKNAIEALYSVAYTLKFTVKREQEIDYSVPPLEGLWWAEDLSDYVKDNRENWEWRMMIMQPEFVSKSLYKKAISQVEEKKKLIALDEIQFEAFREGRSAQTLHIGPFSEEGPTIERVHSFILEGGKKIIGKHHEIYLNDYRRTKPENLKTVIRQPMSL